MLHQNDIPRSHYQKRYGYRWKCWRVVLPVLFTGTFKKLHFVFFSHYLYAVVILPHPCLCRCENKNCTKSCHKDHFWQPFVFLHHQHHLPQSRAIQGLLGLRQFPYYMFVLFLQANSVVVVIVVDFGSWFSPPSSNCLYCFCRQTVWWRSIQRQSLKRSSTFLPALVNIQNQMTKHIYIDKRWYGKL